MSYQYPPPPPPPFGAAHTQHQYTYPGQVLYGQQPHQDAYHDPRRASVACLFSTPSPPAPPAAAPQTSYQGYAPPPPPPVEHQHSFPVQQVPTPSASIYQSGVASAPPTTAPNYALPGQAPVYTQYNPVAHTPFSPPVPLVTNLAPSPLLAQLTQRPISTAPLKPTSNIFGGPPPARKPFATSSPTTNPISPAGQAHVSRPAPRPVAAGRGQTPAQAQPGVMPMVCPAQGRGTGPPGVRPAVQVLPSPAGQGRGQAPVGVNGQAQQPRPPGSVAARPVKLAVRPAQPVAQPTRPQQATQQAPAPAPPPPSSTHATAPAPSLVGTSSASGMFGKSALGSSLFDRMSSSHAVGAMGGLATNALRAANTERLEKWGRRTVTGISSAASEYKQKYYALGTSVAPGAAVGAPNMAVAASPAVAAPTVASPAIPPAGRGRGAIAGRGRGSLAPGRGASVAARGGIIPGRGAPVRVGQGSSHAPSQELPATSASVFPQTAHVISPPASAPMGAGRGNATPGMGMGIVRPPGAAIGRGTTTGGLTRPHLGVMGPSQSGQPSSVTLSMSPAITVGCGVVGGPVAGFAVGRAFPPLARGGITPGSRGGITPAARGGINPASRGGPAGSRGGAAVPGRPGRAAGRGAPAGRGRGVRRGAAPAARGRGRGAGSAAGYGGGCQQQTAQEARLEPEQRENEEWQSAQVEDGHFDDPPVMSATGGPMTDEFNQFGSFSAFNGYYVSEETNADSEAGIATIGSGEAASNMTQPADGMTIGEGPAYGDGSTCYEDALAFDGDTSAFYGDTTVGKACSTENAGFYGPGLPAEENGVITDVTASGNPTYQSDTGVVTDVTASDNPTYQSDTGVITDVTALGNPTYQSDTGVITDVTAVNGPAYSEPSGGVEQTLSGSEAYGDPSISESWATAENTNPCIAGTWATAQPTDGSTTNPGIEPTGWAEQTAPPADNSAGAETWADPTFGGPVDTIYQDPGCYGGTPSGEVTTWGESETAVGEQQGTEQCADSGAYGDYAVTTTGPTTGTDHYADPNYQDYSTIADPIGYAADPTVVPAEGGVYGPMQGADPYASEQYGAVDQGADAPTDTSAVAGYSETYVDGGVSGYVEESAGQEQYADPAVGGDTATYQDPTVYEQASEYQDPTVHDQSGEYQDATTYEQAGEYQDQYQDPAMCEQTGDVGYEEDPAAWDESGAAAQGYEEPTYQEDQAWEEAGEAEVVTEEIYDESQETGCYGTDEYQEPYAEDAGIEEEQFYEVEEAEVYEEDYEVEFEIDDGGGGGFDWGSLFE